LLLAVVTAFIVFMALPTAFVMVLWNATLYESFRLSPEINLYQGFLLWCLFLILFKLIVNPEIQFQIQKPSTDPAKKLKTGKLDKKEKRK
jgi:hypothetical protein